IQGKHMSDLAKTIMVTVIMTVLVLGMAWGYYEAHQWKQERLQQIEQLKRPIPNDS
ncbi:unnamed protein product, partial [marine sediment metagenome]